MIPFYPSILVLTWRNGRMRQNQILTVVNKPRKKEGLASLMHLRALTSSNPHRNEEVLIFPFHRWPGSRPWVSPSRREGSEVDTGRAVTVPSHTEGGLRGTGMWQLRDHRGRTPSIPSFLLSFRLSLKLSPSVRHRGKHWDPVRLRSLPGKTLWWPSSHSLMPAPLSLNPFQKL